MGDWQWVGRIECLGGCGVRVDQYGYLGGKDDQPPAKEWAKQGYCDSCWTKREFLVNRLVTKPFKTPLPRPKRAEVGTVSAM